MSKYTHTNKDGLNESHLATLLKHGDDEAFVILVARFKSKLFRIAYGITHDEEESHDLVQEIFVKVYEKIDTFKEEAEFSTWLYRIAVNHCLNWWRRWKRRFRWHHQPLENESGEISIELVKSENSAEDLYYKKELQQAILTMLTRLPEEAKTIFVLKEIEGLGYDQIAKILNIKTGTVSSRLFYARQKLRILLQDSLDQGKI